MIQKRLELSVAHTYFDEEINCTYPWVDLGEMFTYAPAEILKRVDPKAYQERFNGWCEKNNIMAIGSKRLRELTFI